MSFISLVCAYLGPGGAISAIGSLLALLAAIVVAVFGFIWFPMKRLLRKRAKPQTSNPPSDDWDVSA